MKGTEMDNTGPMTAETKEGKNISNLAFLSLYELQGDIYRGGILVIDVMGKPLEFRCTSPIQPNAVQKTLYGNTLRPHIAVELIAIPLLKAVSEKPHIILIRQAEFFDTRMSIEAPVLLLAKQGAALAVSDDNKPKSKTEMIHHPSGKFDPVLVTPHWKYIDDLHATELLKTSCTSIDLLEPFDRIDKALQFVHDTNPK